MVDYIYCKIRGGRRVATCACEANCRKAGKCVQLRSYKLGMLLATASGVLGGRTKRRVERKV